MGYITYTDIYNVLPQTEVALLTDDALGTTPLNTVMDQAITSADAVINSFLRGQHTVPISPVPALVKTISLDLTKVNLYRRRRSTNADTIDQGIENTYKAAIDMLKMIAKGELTIDDSTAYANTAGMIQSNKDSSSKIYTDTNLDKFQAD